MGNELCAVEGCLPQVESGGRFFRSIIYFLYGFWR